MKDPIYLDYNATTPVAGEIIDAVVPALRDAWGNPSSAHVYGRRARAALERSRSQVAALLGSDTDEVIFTSGGTESDNAAIVGVAEALARRGRHLIISSIEHPAVDEACLYLEGRGWAVTRVPVGGDGRVEPARVEAALRSDTVLVSIMHANNETGVIQPVREISRLVRSKNAVMHTDAAQSAGKVRTEVDDLEVDLLTIAGHKLYAPKGVGALYLRAGTPFAGFLRGAAHEGGRRSGTENTPQIVGLGAACELARKELPARAKHLRAMRDRLEETLRRQIGDLVVHGARVERLPNTLSAAIPGVDANQLLSRLEAVAAAAGAACHSGKSEASHVLKAMGVPEELAVCTLRLTVGRSTTAEEIDGAAVEICRAALALRG
jgi:cysteine desulfurase